MSSLDFNELNIAFNNFELRTKVANINSKNKVIVLAPLAI
jgi:flagellar motor switch protein FliM